MRTVREKLIVGLGLFFVAASQAVAQAPAPPAFLDTTRFTITGAPLLFRPRGEFGQNITKGFGGGGGLLYRLDRTGWLSVRFDISVRTYGNEKKRVPLSEVVGPRVLVDVKTGNSIVALDVGPELALPKGPVRPYLNAAFSGMFFRTSTSVWGDSSSEGAIASTTNHKDNTRAWVLGGGVRVPLPRSDSPFSLDLGLRYHRGGQASYLREGSIQDNPDGSLTITPFNSRTPYAAYFIGVRFDIPFRSSGPCPRFLC